MKAEITPFEVTCSGCKVVLKVNRITPYRVIEEKEAKVIDMTEDGIIRCPHCSVPILRMVITAGKPVEPILAVRVEEIS